MNIKFKNKIISYSILLIIIILFAGADFFIHSLKDIWSVPEYYFRDKIPFGFLWGILGLYFAGKFENIWIKALVFSSTIAVTLQARYFIEGYPLDFVIIFLLFHFLILYALSLGAFKFLAKYF